MATSQEPFKKTSAAPSTSTRPAIPERRGSRRCKITQVMRIRPSDPEKKYFDDLRGTVSVSRSGIYFHTTELGYEVGQRLFVTMPFAGNQLIIGREYLAEVVRKETLENGIIGIGFKTLMEITEQQSHAFGEPGHKN
jgi:PilZ domain